MPVFDFELMVRKYFYFLIDDFHFIKNKNTFGYEKNGLEIEFYYGQGAVDIIFFIRISNETFKPYVSRSFYLLDIINKDVNKIKTGRVEFPENIPHYLTAAEDVDKYLSFCAELMKKYCVIQLEGDLSVFEKIHLQRRKNHAQRSKK
ncbi:hypothetical protein MNBD_GAMMA10-3298 [hydrothermal vent metagenome]|uniref:Uncharacterized protein n=1 Tax=hydrothermal vent metagenome TaxID=652676 RepID=A0A3B0Y595_9ZZZZ